MRKTDPLNTSPEYLLLKRNKQEQRQAKETFLKEKLQIEEALRENKPPLFGRRVRAPVQVQVMTFIQRYSPIFLAGVLLISTFVGLWL